MNMLNENMKNELARKLLFTIRFKLLTEKDFFKVFNLVIFDIKDCKVTKFDLSIEYGEEEEIHLTFKLMDDESIGILYQILSKETGRVMNRFEIFVEPEGPFNEYHSTIKDIFEMVDNKERERQFKLFNSSITDLLKF